MENALLLVDDEEGIRKVLSIYLSDLGFHVYTAADGKQGLDVFREHQPSIVITDIKMPVMDGIELLKRVKQETPETEVIVLTGHGDMELAIQCLKLEAVDFVTKPINDDVLAIALKRAGDKISMRRQLQAYTENLEQLVAEKTARLVAAERKAVVGQALDGFLAAMQNIASDLGPGLGYFNDLPCFVSIHSPDLKIVAANDRFVARLGNLSGAPSWQIYQPDASGRAPCPVGETFASGHGQRTSATAIYKDGARMPVIVHTAPIRNTDGQVALVIEIAADVTEIHRLQDELQTTRARYQQLFDEAPCYITVQDRQLRITAANRRFEQDFGPSVQSRCYEIYQHRSEACVGCPVMLTFQDGKTHQREMDVKNRDGRLMRMLIWTSALRDSGGRITHVMEMSTDVTRMRQMQDQLTTLGGIIGSLSHGIKGMLTGLDGGMYLLDRGFTEDNLPRIREGWDTVRLMIGRIRSLVGDILYFAKEKDLKLDKADLLTLAGELIDYIRPRMERAKIALVCDFEADLADVRIESGLAGAILTNVLENAVHACVSDPDRSKSHEIQFGIHVEKNHVVFTVTDNGCGMDDKTLAKIFTPQLISAKKEGSGLGLYLASRILEKNDGQIDVSSILGRGSVFTVRMPKGSLLRGDDAASSDGCDSAAIDR